MNNLTSTQPTQQHGSPTPSIREHFSPQPSIQVPSVRSQNFSIESSIDTIPGVKLALNKLADTDILVREFLAKIQEARTCHSTIQARITDLFDVSHVDNVAPMVFYYTSLGQKAQMISEAFLSGISVIGATYLERAQLGYATEMITQYMSNEMVVTSHYNLLEA